MKKQIQFVLVFFLCVFSVACDEPDGKASDSIKLSKSKHTFDAKGGVTTISTKSDFWWFIQIKDNDIDVPFHAELQNSTNKDFEFVGEWYQIKRVDRKIEITVSENNTNQPRRLYIHLQAGNWFGSSITINQEAK